MTIKPGFVATPMTANMEQGILFVTPEKVAHDIARAVERHKDVLYTPWFWKWIMTIVKLVPERIFKGLSL